MAETTTIPVTVTTNVAPPGWKTSEFYKGLAALLLTALFGSGLLTNNTALAIAGIAASWLTSLGYTVSRTMVKTAAMRVLPLVILMLAVSQPACAANQRENTIRAALVAVDASRDALIAYDAKHQHELAIAGTPDEARSAVAEYRAKRSKVETAMGAAYRALAVAVVTNDQPSMNGLRAALAVVVEEYASLTGENQ